MTALDPKALEVAHEAWIEGFIAALGLMTGKYTLYDERLAEHTKRRTVLAEIGIGEG